MSACSWCKEAFTPRTASNRFCSRRCAGLFQYKDHPRREHKWGKRPPVDNAHRKLRAELLPAALGLPCPLCRILMDTTAELDHIVPRAQGGKSVRENVRIICRPCNRTRGSKLGRSMQNGRHGPSPTTTTRKQVVAASRNW